MYRKIMIGMLGICLILMLGASADARVCIKKLGGTCVLWSGSLECGIQASGLGNCVDDPKNLACSATGTGAWLVACGNPGDNFWTSPGINTAYFEGTLSGWTHVYPEMCDANGNAYAYVTTDASGAIAAALAAGACPNENWTVIDAVPCSVTLIDYETDADGCKVADATYSCTLPNCAALEWDVTTQHFERRQYVCERIDYNTYKCP